LVAPRSVVSLWKGVTDDDGPVEAQGDHGVACSADGYIGLVPIGELHGLVLGDDPAMTTYLPAERLFLRWSAADDEDELMSAAHEALRTGVEWDEDEDLVWSVDGPVVLFDAAWPGAELAADNHLVVDLQPGRYRVRATYREDGDNWMILVQLQPTPEGGYTVAPVG
jgi:hypothetical protein